MNREDEKREVEQMKKSPPCQLLYSQLHTSQLLNFSTLSFAIQKKNHEYK